MIFNVALHFLKAELIEDQQTDLKGSLAGALRKMGRCQDNAPSSMDQNTAQMVQRHFGTM